MKFGHVALRVKNIQKVLDFYCRGLGFSEAFRILNDDGSLRIVYLHISQKQYLELCLGGGKRPVFDDAKSVGFRHLCFIVDDLANTKKELEEKGIAFDSEILTLRDRNLTAYLFDPDGNKIELVELQPGSPHKEFEKKKASWGE